MTQMVAPVIDAHQHIWDKSRADYPWLGGELAEVDHPFTFADLEPQLDEAGVSATVLVQSADNVEDTTLMLDCAARQPRVVGVVAWVPLDRAFEAAELLAGFPLQPVICGVRTLIHDQPDPHWLERDEVREGLAELERSGYPFDVVAVLPEHLEAVLDLSERYPALPMVIDHLGHPPIGEDGDERWWELIAQTARNPKVSAKISGLYPAGDGGLDARAEAIRPVVEHALTHFGADRLMYGGDWPISVLHGGYANTWSSLEPIFAVMSTAERCAVLGGTASTFYGLDLQHLTAAAGGAA